MPGPKLGPCGHAGEPACPPENASGVYTPDQMAEHGHLNYHKGAADLWEKISAVIEDPAHGWGDGELPRAIRAVVEQ